MRDGGAIRTGFDAELDELRLLSTNADQFLVDLEEREKAATGIATLKPFAESVTCSQPWGSPGGAFSTGALSPAVHAAMARNFRAQLSGATLAQLRSRASRAHSSAART